MGQQQLLLLVLASILTGAGVLLGVNLFQENAVQANLDAVMQDCFTIAIKAQAWYKRPSSMGGGGHDFSSITFGKLGYATDPYLNDNGSYSFSTITQNTLEIIGDGKDSMDGDVTPLKVKVTVSSTQAVVTDVQK
jgi:hypothetical protein